MSVAKVHGLGQNGGNNSFKIGNKSLKDMIMYRF